MSVVRTGDAFARLGEGDYVLAPERGREGYDQLVRDLAASGRVPTRIGHFWLVTTDRSHRPGSSFFHRVQEQGFWSLFSLAQAMGEEGWPSVHLTVFTTGAQAARGERLAQPEKGTVMGPARVIPREFPGTTVAVVDIAATDAEGVVEELLARPANLVAVRRGEKRFVQPGGGCHSPKACRNWARARC